MPLVGFVRSRDQCWHPGGLGAKHKPGSEKVQPARQSWRIQGGAGHRRTPRRPRRRHGEDRPMGAGKPGAQGPRNDRRFPPPGVKDGSLVRRRKGSQKVLWSLADNGKRERIKNEEPIPKTGSRFVTASQTRDKREAVSCWKFNALPCGKPTASHFSPSIRAREAV